MDRRKYDALPTPEAARKAARQATPTPEFRERAVETTADDDRAWLESAARDSAGGGRVDVAGARLWRPRGAR